MAGSETPVNPSSQSSKHLKEDETPQSSVSEERTIQITSEPVFEKLQGQAEEPVFEKLQGQAEEPVFEKLQGQAEQPVIGKLQARAQAAVLGKLKVRARVPLLDEDLIAERGRALHGDYGGGRRLTGFASRGLPPFTTGSMTPLQMESNHIQSNREATSRRVLNTDTPTSSTNHPNQKLCEITQFLPKLLSKAKLDETEKLNTYEELKKWLEEEDKSEGIGEKKEKKKHKVEESGKKEKKGSASSIRHRKRVRLAIRPKLKSEKAKSPSFVDLSEERVFVQGEHGSVMRSFPVDAGFAASSSPSSSQELKELKDSVKESVRCTANTSFEGKALEKVVADLVQASKELTSAMQQSTSTLSQGQADLLKKLEDLVIEKVPVNDVGEEHQSSAPEA